MKRILIIGSSCSGKTTLGKTLGEITTVPHFDLDDFHWLPNWTEVEDSIMVENLKAIVKANPTWIFTGSYHSLTKNILWPIADTVIWLKYPLRLLLYRWFTRTTRLIITKGNTCNGNVETFSHAFLSSDNLFFWILKTYKSRMAKYAALRAGEFQHLNWVVFHSQKETDAFLQTVQANKNRGN